MRTRRIVRFHAVTMALAVLGSLTALASPAHALGPPELQQLDPSSHSDVLSDRAAANSTYRLAAWAKGLEGFAPGSQFLVEWEIRDDTGPVARVESDSRVGDTFYKQWDIPSGVANDTYTLRARLYVDEEGDGFIGESAVATDDRAIELVHNTDFEPEPIGAAAAETVDIVSPAADGQTGWSDPPGDTDPFFLIDAVSSTGTAFVTIYYTVTPPGDEPVWNSCSGPNAGSGARTYRCTILDAHSPNSVTGFAAVANDTPAGPYDAGFDESGDALQVFPYEQTATSISLTPDVQDIVAGANNAYACATLTVEVLDQNGRRVAAANFDVHAQGPDNNIKFNTSGTTPAVRAPNSGSDHESEPGTNCSGANSAAQANHHILGVDDIKHVEGETADNGRRSFQIDSTGPGITNLEAWLDTTENDAFESGAEPIDSARVRWGQILTIEPAAGSAQRLTCHRLEVIATEGNPATPVVGANIDVHISGPTGGVDFCSPPDATLGQHGPDAPGHSDVPGTKHIEGPTNASGKFIFGVRSPATGDTSIVAWRDDVDDDSSQDDRNVSAMATWTPASDRSITIASGRKKVPSGRRTKISGRIIGDAACAAFQAVKVQARGVGMTKWYQVKVLTTNESSRYSYVQRINRTRDYRAVAPQTGDCDRAESPVIRIRKV